jgi:hypothetical protein
VGIHAVRGQLIGRHVMRFEAVVVRGWEMLPILVCLVSQRGIQDNAENAANVWGPLSRLHWSSGAEGDRESDRGTRYQFRHHALSLLIRKPKTDLTPRRDSRLRCISRIETWLTVTASPWTALSCRANLNGARPHIGLGLTEERVNQGTQPKLAGSTQQLVRLSNADFSYRLDRQRSCFGRAWTSEPNRFKICPL